MVSEERVAIPGSDRELDPRHARLGDIDYGEQAEVTVYLRRTAPLDWVDEQASRGPHRRMLSHSELAQMFGASEADVAAVRSFAQTYGLESAAVDHARRAVVLRGLLGAFAAALGVTELGVFEHPTGGAYRGRDGVLTVPSELAGVISGVFGIDTRPLAEPHVRRAPPADRVLSYSPREIAQAYGFPSGLDGGGQTVAIVELGGGYRESDLARYFGDLGLTQPHVHAVAVNGGINAPGIDPTADRKVMLDTCVVGAIAPGARIVIYFADRSERGFIDALSTIVHDSSYGASVALVGWGASEELWTRQALHETEQILLEAAAVGITVSSASGDGGSTDGVADGRQHVNFPASAPHALACGGTSIHVGNPSILSETTWNDGAGGGAAGGGISVAFQLPSYQVGMGVPVHPDTGLSGRGVPDVSGHADPRAGYTIVVDSAYETVGGTGAAAPLWAGLTALVNQCLGKPVGFLQPALYSAHARQALNDITTGTNGAFHAGPGWDACTGLGSPDGTALLDVLGGDGARFFFVPPGADEPARTAPETPAGPAPEPSIRPPTEPWDVAEEPAAEPCLGTEEDLEGRPGVDVLPPGADVRLAVLLDRALRRGIVPADLDVAQRPAEASWRREIPWAASPPSASTPEKSLPTAPRRGAASLWLRVVGAAVSLGILYELAKRIFGVLAIDPGAGEHESHRDNGDLVDCTIFAPPTVSPGDSVLIQVFAHLARQTDDARALATEFDPGTRRRAFRSLQALIQPGAVLTFELHLPGAEISSTVETLTWQRRAESVQFDVVFPDCVGPSVIGTVWVSLDGAPLGHMKFKLMVAATGATIEREPVGDLATRYKAAFISYAAADRDEVLRRVQMLQAVKLSYFEDLLDLEPGDDWWPALKGAIDVCDLFLLFWSSGAKQSEWVRKEVLHALERQAGDSHAPPEIRPVILEGPPIVPPWDELAHLHFNDRLVYFMSPGSECEPDDGS